MNNPPLKPNNKDVRSREYLTIEEIKSMTIAAKKLRNSTRNEALIFAMFRHALRVQELITLKWNQICFERKFIQVNRIKNGISGTHPLSMPLLKLLKSLKKSHNLNTYFVVNEVIVCLIGL
jgi:type 1 fimbriae regulatory protein FimE